MSLRHIIHIVFRSPVTVGGRAIDYWSGRPGQLDELLNKIKVSEPADRPDWIYLTWTGRVPSPTIEVPRDNVVQIEREVEEPKERKK